MVVICGMLLPRRIDCRKNPTRTSHAIPCRKYVPSLSFRKKFPSSHLRNNFTEYLNWKVCFQHSTCIFRVLCQKHKRELLPEQITLKGRYSVKLILSTAGKFEFSISKNTKEILRFLLQLIN